MEQVVTNRMQDVAYVQSLHENRDRQMANAYAREKVASRQKVCMERVKASLPENADEAGLKAALQKDSEWVKLEAEAQKVAVAEQQARQGAKMLIRGRLEQEAQDIKDVQSGKARVAVPVRPE